MTTQRLTLTTDEVRALQMLAFSAGGAIDALATTTTKDTDR